MPTLSEEYLQLAYIFILDFSKIILHVGILDMYFANCFGSNVQLYNGGYTSRM